MAAPAVADGGEETGGAVASNNSRVARGGSVVPAARPENAGPGTRRGGRIQVQPTDDGGHPQPDWCHFDWPAWWIVPPQVYYRQRNMFILPQAPIMASPPSLVAGVADTGAHASTDVDDAAPAEPAAAAVEGAPNAPASGPPAFAVSSPLLPPVRLDAPSAPAMPPSLPESVAPAPNRASVRLPDIPSPNLGHIAAVALPGLAGIAALTALGGFLGYRQAKAGYVLRAAGTARFLQ